MKLFEYSPEIDKLRHHIETVLDAQSGEIDDNTELMLAGLGSLINDRAEKISHIANLIIELEVSSDARKAVANKIIERATAEMNKARRLREYLAYNMTAGEKIDGMTARISCKTSESVIIDDVNLLPSSLTVTEIKGDKKAIKLAMQTGTVAGAHIEEKKGVTIR
jgi:hypothetical protein